MDNVTNIEPADNEERLLKGILDGETTTDIEPVGNEERLLYGILKGETESNIEPASRVERLLKAILENGGGGGGLPVVKTIKTDGEHYYGIQFDDVDYIAEENLFWISDASGFSDYFYWLCVPHINHSYSTKTRARLTLIYQGDICVCTATKSQSDGVWMFSNEGINIELAEARTPYIYQSFGNYQEGYIQVLTDPTEMVSTWKSPQAWWSKAGIQIDIANVTDMTDAETMLNQAISGMKSLASASLETTVAKYMTLPAAYQYVMTTLISQWETSLTENKNPVYIAFNSGTFVVTDVRYTAPLNESFATAVYKEIDFTNNYIYDMTITFNAQKLFFECTCHEATSLT